MATRKMIKATKAIRSELALAVAKSPFHLLRSGVNECYRLITTVNFRVAHNQPRRTLRIVQHNGSTITGKPRVHSCISVSC
jgi:hypothetical protein